MQEMLDHIEQTLHQERTPSPDDCPTYEGWFNGRFWREWVISERNKPSEQISKHSSFKDYPKPAFGPLRLDEIGVEQIQQLTRPHGERKRPLSDKSVGNVMAVLGEVSPLRGGGRAAREDSRIRLRRVVPSRRIKGVDRRRVRHAPQGGEEGDRRGGMRRCAWLEKRDCASARSAS